MTGFHQRLLSKWRWFTPSQDAQAIDHGGVWVGSHHTVGVDEAVADLDDPGQVLQIHLVDRTDVRRNHVHILKSFWTPLLVDRQDYF